MVSITMAKSILVTGAKGQLGQSIQKISQVYAKYHFTFVDIEDLDLTSNVAIDQYFADKCFDIVVNCAAYTAVDQAESELELADKINHLAVKRLAQIAKEKNMRLIHISTDYVFNGQNYRPYIESDVTDPQNIYGTTKLKGEQAICEISPVGCIIRTSWVYSEFGNNFVKTMLRLGVDRDSLNVIFDQIGSPTYATDLAKAIIAVIISESKESRKILDCHVTNAPRNDNYFQIYNYSNEGVCSWYDFAKAIFELSDIECQVSPIETKDYPTPAKRPHYSLLNKSKIKNTFDIEIPYWLDSLKECLTELKK